MSLSSNRFRTNALSLIASAVLLLTAPVTMAQGSSPMFNYLQHCVGCHLPDGSGFPPEVPNLRNDFGYLIDSPEGRDFMSRVPGVVGAPMNAEDTAALLNWMITTFSPAGTEFEPFTSEEILAGRERPLHDPLKYRQQLLPEH